VLLATFAKFQMHNIYYITGNFKRDMSALSAQQIDGITISNTPAQIKFLGVLLVHHSFIKLQKAFSSKIAMMIMDVDSDLAALWSATKLGYQDSKIMKIKHSFSSITVQKILSNNHQRFTNKSL
jgi:hypothetical protein